MLKNNSFFGGSLKVVGHDSVLLSSNTSMLNHYEVRVNATSIEVYGTDPFAGALDLTKTPLHHLASITATIPLTKGLIWIEDAHYNGDKDLGAGSPNQRVHTFNWDNVGFDGPKTYRDWGFGVSDNIASGIDPNTQLTTIDRTYNIPSGSKDFTTESVKKGIATTALLVYTQLSYHNAGYTISYAINGHAHTMAWPYPDQLANSPHTLDIPVDINEVVAGPNKITFTNTSGDGNFYVANIDLIMVHAAEVP